MVDLILEKLKMNARTFVEPQFAFQSSVQKIRDMQSSKSIIWKLALFELLFSKKIFTFFVNTFLNHLSILHISNLTLHFSTKTPKKILSHKSYILFRQSITCIQQMQSIKGNLWSTMQIIPWRL